MAQRKVKASFIEPMLLLRKEKLPEGAEWLYELKLDGYRAVAIKTDRKVQLRSRNNNDFSLRYPGIVKALASLHQCCQLTERDCDAARQTLNGHGEWIPDAFRNRSFSAGLQSFYPRLLDRELAVIGSPSPLEMDDVRVVISKTV